MTSAMRWGQGWKTSNFLGRTIDEGGGGQKIAKVLQMSYVNGAMGELLLAKWLDIWTLHASSSPHSVLLSFLSPSML